MSEDEHSEPTDDATRENLRAANPFQGADLVLYSAEATEVSVDPATEVLEELDLISWSLWARFEDDGVELPIVGESSNHVWYSLSPETFHPDPADAVSEAFATVVAQMVDDDIGDGWGDIQDDVWSDLSDLERYVVNLVKHGFLTMEAAEPALVIDWCQQQTEVTDS